MSELQIVRTVAEPVGESATEHEVPMRDGTVLATDVYLPSGVAHAPTVLVRLPYDKNSRYVFFDRIARRFTDRGYAMVVQDVRGKFRSQGPTVPFLYEVEDGYDTIDWIVAQHWSDGAVGMFGDSYYGFTQWAAVVSAHPALKAIVPRVTTYELSSVNSYGVGGFGEPVPWMEGSYYLATHWVDHEAYEYDANYDRRPLTDAFDEAFQAIGARSSSFDSRIPVQAVEKGPFDHGHPRDAKPVPVLQTVGWFDNLMIPQMRDVMELESLPHWAAVQYIEAGSFDHENYVLDLAPVGDADDHGVDDDALERMLDLYTSQALDFLDVFVRGLKSPDTLPKVRWELGHVGWQTSSQWPPPGASKRSFDLTGLSSAAGATPGGHLVDAGAGEAGEVQWGFDPDNLVPSAVKNSFAYLVDYPDESATGDRGDVLTFTSERLTEPLDLAGPIEVEARVSSTAPSADVFVKLLDVAPDGSAHMIVRGQVQLEDAKNVSRAHVNLGHTGYRVRPNHALRIHISSSDFPLFVRNSGTEENRWTVVEPRASQQTLHVSAEWPARLTVTALSEERNDAS